MMLRLNAIILSVSVLGMTLPSKAQQAPQHEYKPDGYHIETIPVPKDREFHITGLDSKKDGTIFVAIRLGEVWFLKNNKWQLFAEGLHDPTGLKIDDDGSVLVAQKPELTRLVDNNGDGIADEYRSFATGWDFHDNYHEYNFGPTKDQFGNYYGTLNLSHNNPEAFTFGVMGSPGGYRGFAYKVNKHGDFKPYAWGLRSPAGIGTSPLGDVFFTDNQGDWVPTSKMHLLEQGKFYGHPVSLIDVEGYDRKKVAEMSVDEFAKMAEKPVVWIPHVEVANSPGNPEWDVSDGKFGPFAGQIFIGDQTQSNVFRVLLDKVNGQYQGAVINFMNKFQSGNIRTKFDAQGQLWVGQATGGWGAAGPKPFGLQKVVWDGTVPFELLDIKLTTTGFRLSFTDKIDPSSATLGKVSAQQWHYHYSGNYGSPKKNLKDLKVTNISVSADGQFVDVILPLTADKVVQVNFSGIKDVNGRSVSVDRVYYTLNQLLIE